MNNNLLENIRYILKEHGPLGIHAICDEVHATKTDVQKILEDNPYTFDFELDFTTKKWFTTE